MYYLIFLYDDDVSLDYTLQLLDLHGKYFLLYSFQSLLLYIPVNHFYQLPVMAFVLSITVLVLII